LHKNKRPSFYGGARLTNSTDNAKKTIAAHHFLLYYCSDSMNPIDNYVEQISSLHIQEYDDAPDVIVSAPAIIRLLGEQLVEIEGMYIALPLDMKTVIAVSARKDTSIRFFAADINERKRTNITNLRFKREDRWANHVKAAFYAFFSAATPDHGYNVTILGNIPHGLGFGSSESLVCAAIWAVANVTGQVRSPEDVVRMASKLEIEYFEKDAPQADYTALVQARPSSMLYVDGGKDWVEPLPFLFADCLMVFTDSRVPRVPIDKEIAKRSNDSHNIVQLLGKEKRRLRDIDLEEFDEYTGLIPESARRHSIFMIEEIQRIREARDAAANKDLLAFSRLINKSQAGLRNYYEVSCPEIDWLVKRALEIDGVLASRMIGKGFGGCTLTIMRPDTKSEYLKRLDEYERIFGFKPQYWEAQCGSGLSTYVPSILAHL